MVDVRELFLQRTPSTDLYQFDIFVSRHSAEEQHFYCHGLTAADFAAVFRRELAGKTVYITKFSPGILNPSYWETYTSKGEQDVRAAHGGVLVKEEGGSRFIWRSDRVPKGRKLIESVGVDPELVNGTTLSIPGPDFAKIAEALHPLRDDLQFGVVESTGNHHMELAKRVAEDARALRRSSKDEFIVYASRGNYIAQIVFSARASLLKALEASIRGFAHRISRCHVAYINHQVLEDLAHVLDRAGAVAYSHRDLIVKDTHLELTLHLGKSQWPPEIELPYDRRALLYYDRTAGIWAFHL
jgi:hypothetical protein